jgi:hypothetical protein
MTSIDIAVLDTEAKLLLLLFYIPPYPIHDGEVDLLGQARNDTSAITGPFIYSLGIT